MARVLTRQSSPFVPLPTLAKSPKKLYVKLAKLTWRPAATNTLKTRIPAQLNTSTPLTALVLGASLAATSALEPMLALVT